MILSANTLEANVEHACDLCIIGAGAAGITLALQFLNTGLSVILLEGGGLAPDAATQALYAGTVTDKALHHPPDRYRERRLGGTSTVWSGRCIPFDPIDFETRPWVPHSGWPIRHAAVARWYPAAMALCEAGEAVFSATAAVPGGMRPTIRTFEPDGFDLDSIERFSMPTDFGTRYRRRLERAQEIKVLLHANATELISEADGTRVARVAVATLAGRRFTVAARQVVLASGGLETPRLLLASRQHHAAGLGNAHGLVGAYYMGHIAGTIGALEINRPRKDVWSGYDVAEDGTYCRRRWTLSEAAQRDNGVANAILRLHFPAIRDPRHGSGPLSAIYLAKPLGGYEYARRLGHDDGAGGRWFSHAKNVLREPLATADFFWHTLMDRKLAARKFPSLIVQPSTNRFSLDFHGEQVPNPDSRVTLGPELDALGMPRIAIDWRYSPLDIRTAEVALSLLDAGLQRWGHGRLSYDRDRVAHHMLRDGAYVGHHIGTARMGATPRCGVVDPDGRVHGMHNLSIAGAAIFPTSGQANPTLTVVALALRLAETLRRSFAAPLMRGAPREAVPAP